MGWVFQTNPEASSPYDELASITNSNVNDICDNWSGRWVLIFENKIYTDATGTLGVFYTRLKDEGVCISSSLALMKSIFDIEQEEFLFSNYHWDWFPGPKTCLKNVNILFSSQRLQFSRDDYSLEFHSSIDTTTYARTSDEELIYQISTRLSTLMKNVGNLNEKVILRLSGGNDSRVLLAALLASKINFTAVTFNYKNIKKCDIRIPKNLAKDFGFQHQLINPGPYKIEREKEIHQQSLNHADKHDLLYYCTGILDTLGQSIVLHGGIWEIARSYFTTLSAIENQDSDDLKIKVLETGVFPEITTSKVPFESLKLWLAYTKDHPIDIKWENRFTFDQNMGCWLSYNRQAMDLMPFFLFSVINSRKMLSLILSISPELRKNGRHQEEIIRVLEPKLLIYPYNQEYFDEKIIRSFHKIKNRTVKYYKKLKRKTLVYSTHYMNKIGIGKNPQQ